jgi:hypothetical protein
VSVTDDSKGNGKAHDVSEVIVKLLSCGAKTPRELKKAALGAVNVCERTYFRHLNNLCNRAVIEEVADLSPKGKVIKRYVLKKAEEPKNLVLSSEQMLSCEGCGSKWVFVGVGNIVSRLVECPLCCDMESS